MKYVLWLFFCLLITLKGWAQPKEKREKKDPYTSKEIWSPVPINRQLAHDKLDKVQRKCDELDGQINQMIFLAGDSAGSVILTEAIIDHVDRMQAVIENLPLDHYKKIQYLSDLELGIRSFPINLANQKIPAQYYLQVVLNFERLMKANEEGEEVLPMVRDDFSRSFEALQHMFKNNTEAISAMYTNLVRLYPEEMFTRFQEIYTYAAAEHLFSWLAPKQPNLILTYAMSTSIERQVVRRCQDTLIRQIVTIADKARSPWKALVYLDDLRNGQISIAEINSVTETPELYYKSLVKQRLKSNTLTRKQLDRESKLQALEYVRIMNELHDSPDPVRFKCLENLSAQEMYFLMVLCSDEIYTSTFVGTFNRMLVKMAPLAGDEFLQGLNMDKFRTFIRMCAGYNKLDEFIATIQEDHRNQLMARFVNQIDKNKESDLEDAVDVADSFGSINDPRVLEYLLSEVLQNYERTYQENNKRGLIIYFLLHTLCASVLHPESSSIELQDQLKVPPITRVPYQHLLNDTGAVVEQVFFYGDEDGQSSFANFMANFNPAEWSTVKNSNWVTLSSLKGKPITIYANLPLPEPQDEEAQKALCSFLEQQKIKPTVMVHRGHSYHLPTTMSRLGPSNRIIILGSCGGYHNLSTILEHSEDAHIISSKQTGSMRITDPILKQVHQLLQNGQDINWIELWASLDPMMNTPQLQDLFNDYVPPHKNMGALFLKAFKIQMTEQQKSSSQVINQQ